MNYQLEFLDLSLCTGYKIWMSGIMLAPIMLETF